jgi:hypothetical protein
MSATVTFLSVLNAAAQMVGLTPGSTLTTEVAESFASYITRAIRETRTAFRWASLELTQERYYRIEWDNGTTYAAGDEVWSTTEEKYYRSKAGSNTNHAVTDTAWWEEAGDLARYVSKRQTSKTEIDAVYSAHDTDPRGTMNPTGRKFRLSGEYIIFDETAPDSVWLVFRKQIDAVTTTAWASGSYAVGDVVYYAPDCYQCIAAATTQNPTDTTKWTKVEIPIEWAGILAARAATDYARADGNLELAATFEIQAARALNSAMEDAAHRQHQQHPLD